jgi:hypothetical protein
VKPTKKTKIAADGFEGILGSEKDLDVKQEKDLALSCWIEAR